MVGPDHAHMRISDDDRHKVAEVLREAAGDGRIDLSELDERLEAAYSAKTYADLVPITVDLPAHGEVVQHRPAPSPVPAATYTGSIAVMSETKRRGVWLVESRHSALAVMGSVLIDLREAQFTSPEVVITANAVMGEVKVLVNPTTVVIVEGTAIMGEYTEQRARAAAELTPGSPVVRVKGFALMGSVNVQRRAMPGQEPNLRQRLGW